MQDAGFDESTIAERLRTFFVEDLRWDVAPEQMDAEFMITGRIDSLGLFDLIGFLEDEFGVHVANEELAPGNFDSFGDVVRLVKAKAASAA
jgi:acyl carrier protein